MLLELKDVRKCFPGKRRLFHPIREDVRAVDDVSLQVREGENLGLVGESGCGKTTLARLILKLTPMDSGAIIFEGRDISSLGQNKMRPIRRNLQMVFQDPYSSLDPRFTVRGILQEAQDILRQDSSKGKEAQRVELLKAVGLEEDALNRFPHEFSGGERQRIAIARALVFNPRLLILDEAVSSLDVLVQQQIIDLLGDLQKRFHTTYLFISHNLRIARKISSRVAVMFKGKIVETAPTEELFRHPVHPYTRALLSAAMDYQVASANDDMTLERGLSLVEKGPGHFVYC
ncbi:MAG: ATP-binding cassette domain-containing protein [Candidatus Omnitrophota bacterium]